MNSHPNQYSFIREYNEQNREPFNDKLFHRDENEIIEELKKVILSIERNKYFTIKVEKFTVVEDYNEIKHLLREQEKYKSKTKISDKDNKHTYIPLKDSDIKLLIVDYYIEVPFPKEEKYRAKNLRVLIEVPRIVDKYYFKIFGNMYSAIYQIVDGSTYNNSQAVTSKNQCVALKTLFMASRIFRYVEDINTIKSEKLKCIYYHSVIFDKGVPLMKYLLARYGFYETMTRLMISGIMITEEPVNDDDYYCIKKLNLYLSIPKYIFDNDLAAQSLIYTIMININKQTTLNDIHTKEYWIISLGESFNNPSTDKGERVLESLESVYDIPTKESIKLPEDDKKDIYDIIVWIIREFSKLRQKDNLDISIKRIRFPEYFSAIYALRLSNSLYRISNEGSKIQLSHIEKAIYTFPDYLLKQITKDTLVNYKNSVNDIDAILALKYTFKGVSGLGEGKANSVPISYKQVHLSHLGRLDLDSSTANDPGLSGMICPLADITDSYTFSDYQEPNEWRQETDELYKEYMKLAGLKQTIKFQKEIGIDTGNKEEIIEESMNIIEKLAIPVAYVDKEIDKLSTINKEFL